MAMPGEKISYRAVEAGVEEIRKSATEMEDIFNTVTGEVGKMTDTDTLVGRTSDAFSSTFDAEIKSNFPSYLAKVREFADVYEAAAKRLEEDEIRTAKEAQEI